ncbi:helix-turn-helix domain-containing protein [Micromonospora ureilytica]|uniref:helix-turn-helix domain-containing protein n=1 Tax=Micromonospora ureilytica TaxID=709868 RepID=UPI002E105300|nr:helix-turn-helix domain-containing protein [Micromonospora ureilytica]
MTTSPETPDRGEEQPEPGWSVLLTRRVAAEVRYWREQRGISALQLAKKTAELGYQLPRSVLANLENNRRDTVTVAELLILAAALDVPPVLLIAPVGRESDIEMLPTTRTAPWHVRGWIHGAVEPNYPGFSPTMWQQSRRAITLYDIHRLLVREHQQIQRRIQQLADQEHLVVDEITSDDLRLSRGPLAEFLTELAYSFDRLRTHRGLIKAEGFRLPDLPPSISAAMKETAPSGRHRQASKDDQDDRLLPPLVYQELIASRPDLGGDEPDRESRD